MLIQLQSHMNTSKKGSNKYNKVNQQKKFHLLTLIYKQRIPIKEVYSFHIFRLLKLLELTI